MTRAILMAAGQGTRISRSINDYCKCTLDIGGIPLIRYTAEMLLNDGIDVHIVVGYDKQRIKNALKGLDIVYHENVFYSITNSLASLWFAREAIACDTLILGNADVYWETDLLSVLIAEERDCIMLCDTSRVEEGDYLLRVENGKILNRGKGNNCYEANCEYVGLAAIRKEMISKCRERLELLIQQQRYGDWWEEILYSMMFERPIWAKDIAGKFWAEIDFIEDYEKILRYRNNVK
ncbi:nucleotidyltransferase [Clostridia bacterium]|nr:nucleotidyltransferase [Clostridia bacterium]